MRVGRIKLEAILHEDNPLRLHRKLSLSDLSHSPVAFPSNIQFVYPHVVAKFKEKGIALPSFQHIDFDMNAAIAFLKNNGVLLTGPNNPLLVAQEDLTLKELDDNSAIVIPVCLTTSAYESKSAVELLKTYLYSKAPKLW